MYKVDFKARNFPEAIRFLTLLSTTILNDIYISLGTVVLNSRDRQGMYGMQHFRTPRNPPYKRI